ncbi:hypothetical protein D3C80_1724860 [compost metagenome]
MRVVAFRVSVAPLSICPPALLFKLPATSSCWSPPLERMPLPLLSRLAALTFSRPWLARAPSPLFCRAPLRSTVKLPLRLERVPRLRLSRLWPLTLRPCHPESKPPWLFRAAPARPS